MRTPKRTEGATRLPATRLSARRARRGGLVGLVLVVLLGLLFAAQQADSAYAQGNARAKEAFRAEGSSVASALLTSIERDQDYMATLRSLFSQFPGITNRQFARWSAGLRTASRYPGDIGYGYIELVRRADLPRFRAEIAADPPLGHTPAPFSILPGGSRPTYCLMRLAAGARFVIERQALSFDYCFPSPLSPFHASFPLAVRRGALAAAGPISMFPDVFFMVEPVFAGATVPKSVAARQRALRGWAVGTFSASATVTPALRGQQHLAVRLRFLVPGERPITLATLGGHPRGRHLALADPAGAGASWQVVVTGGPGSGALGDALTIGGLVLGLTVVLALLVLQLIRSRTRALTLVDERTGELRHQALHDSLTGLPNRALVVDRAEQMLARAQREDVATGILFVDLDNFKDINDSFGHQRGDELLQAVARRLVAVVRPSDSVGRLGGDEFVVLVEDRSVDEASALVAGRILEALREPFELEGLAGVKLAVRASVGVAFSKAGSAEELLRDADVALYQAKQAGGGRYVVFHPDMQLAVLERLGLEIDLRQAIEERQLYVDYQPIFDLSSMEMTGVEALVRWRHPQRGVLAPDVFIPLAERTGLIDGVGRFVLTESCAQVARWAQAGHIVHLSVNISGRQLDSDALRDDVRAALAHSGLDARQLTLELTETVLMNDADSTLARLRALKELGVRIAIDDFGTGYSSLGYIRQFPIDTLKIDRSFIAAVPRSPEARALLQTLVQLGKSLGLDTLAEGIEDETQLVELQRQECDQGQGFLYSRPVAPEAIEELLAGAKPRLDSAARLG
ncbi:MAG: EAL domain-containing protein [Actinomycetota bacterium]|nr:EAL domain-containing protein [Actinomycetota bacterium]